MQKLLVVTQMLRALRHTKTKRTSSISPLRKRRMTNQRKFIKKAALQLRVPMSSQPSLLLLMIKLIIVQIH